MSITDFRELGESPDRPNVAPKGSILQAFPPTLLSGHFLNGYTFRLDPCGVVTGYDPNYCAPGEDKMLPQFFGPEVTVPVRMIQAAFACSTIGVTDEELIEKASVPLKSRLWTKVDETLIGLLNTQSILQPSTLSTPGGVLAEAAQYLATYATYGTGIIYGPMAWFSQLGMDYQIKWDPERNVYKDVAGNYIIPTSQNSPYVYAFDSDIDIKTSELQILDAFFPALRNTNDRIVRAEQLYTVAIGACVVGAFAVDEQICMGTPVCFKLTALDDSVTVEPGISPLNVNIVSGGGGGSVTARAEDTPAIPGALGDYVLNVRSDVPTSNTSADGDYASFQSDKNGSLWISPTAKIATTLSSVVPLAGNASFTSPWIPVDGFASIRMGVLTDQAGTLFTQHSDDNGVTIVRNSNQPIEANKPEFLSFYPRSSFFRVLFTNGPTLQTQLHLETILHTVALDNTQSQVSSKLGRTSIATQTRNITYDYEFDESAGVAPQIRDLFVSQRVSLIADNFRQTSDLDTQSWVETNFGTGSSSVTNGRLEMITGATADSTTRVESVVRGRFLSGSHQLFRVGIKLPDAGAANNRMRWGAYDDISGYFFELEGAVLYAVSRRASTDTRVAAANWNTINTYVLSAGGGSARYEIAYFGNTAYFIVNGETHHVMSGEVGGLPRTNGSNFPNRFENINFAGNTANRMLVVTGTSQQRYGPEQVNPRMFFISGAGTTTIKSDCGNLHRISVLDGAGVNTATVYDSLVGAGSVIAILNVDKLQGSVEFGGVFNTGLTIVTTGAETKLSVVFD